MKALMVLDHEFPPDIRVEKEIKSLSEIGIEVHLACYTKKGLPAIEKTEYCTIHRVPISEFYYKSSVGALKFPFYFNFWRRFISRLFLQYHFDVIHIHDLPLGQVGLEMKNKFGANFVLDLHENWPALLSISEHTKTFLGKLLSSDKQWRKYETKVSNAADYIVVVADEMRKRMEKTGTNNSSFYVVPNTLELNSYNKFHKKAKNERFILYYAGGLTVHRGVQVVIQSIARLSHEMQLELWVVGAGKYRSVLEEMTRNFGVSDRVKFFGWQSQDKVYEYLFKCDAALIPHLKTEHSDNTSPNKIFQYMQAGIPILSTNCNYLRNIIEECQSGLVYEHDNPEDLAHKIEQLYYNKILCSDLGQNGMKAVQEKYNWNNTVKPLLDLYKSI